MLHGFRLFKGSNCSRVTMVQGFKWFKGSIVSKAQRVQRFKYFRDPPPPPLNQFYGLNVLNVLDLSNHNLSSYLNNLSKYINKLSITYRTLVKVLHSKAFPELGTAQPQLGCLYCSAEEEEERN